MSWISMYGWDIDVWLMNKKKFKWSVIFRKTTVRSLEEY